MSKDKTMCHRQKGESCSKNDQCQPPLKCINETCNCPSNTSYVTTKGRLGMKSVSRCIPNGVPALKANETCKIDNDLCDNKLRCVRCAGKGDSRTLCLSDLTRSGDDELGQENFKEMSASGADQVTMTARVVGYISLLATVVVMLC
ncbi:hypothetical protein NP493_32g04005 [Ridgeia piscesae]|uniref:Uncharacterized protein n=1 Tax=Ridgeia piscesae TaxID=27915 RepID=A0AAD9UK98_RIDPI|nr:hypothetical protein NP493_32g04005 [Ridgeia piscesae]